MGGCWVMEGGHKDEMTFEQRDLGQEGGTAGQGTPVQ